jgi:hypothetical protein
MGLGAERQNRFGATRRMVKGRELRQGFNNRGGTGYEEARKEN